MSLPIDTYRPQRRPIEIAAECARAGRTEEAQAIRDLYELAKAYQRILVAYRTGGRTTPESALDTANRLEWMIR